MPAAHEPGLPLSLPIADRRPLLRGEWLVVLASLFLVWFLVWSYPLIPPDEGRYGSASASMAESGQWLVPHFRGRAHLTKPPLTYWLQAMGVFAFGRTELAVRWPSLIATSLGLLVLFRFVRSTLGTRPAVVAIGLASVTPLVVVVGRLANTDALLALAWITMLASGQAIASAPARRAPSLILFWLAFALGVMTKGPAAFGPLIILGAWHLLAGRPGMLLRYQPFLGLPLAILPTAVWIGYVLNAFPEAKSLWWDETFGRVTGEKALRAEPWWYYLPVFLVGLYPATTMLAIPFFNLSARDAWRTLRQGDVRSLAILAVVLPFVGFSLSTGKLATYLLPLAAPTALLAALTIERWLAGEFERPVAGYRPPDVRYTFAVVAGIVFVAELGGAIYLAEYTPELWALIVPLAVVPIAAGVLWWSWGQGPAARWRGLAVAWVGLATSWTIIFGLQTRYVTPMGSESLLQAMSERFALDRPQIVTVAFVDPTIEFYNGGRPTLEAASLAELRGRNFDAYPVIVLVRPTHLEQSIADAPEVASRLQPIATWTRWFAAPTRVYLLGPPVAQD